MLIREFLNWTEGASAEARADAAGALAKAYLYGELDPIDTGEAMRALTVLLDDPSPLVRRVLAEAFATAIDAPHHILVALTSDRSDIAAIVLARSSVLTDAELIDAVAIGDAVSQCAVAGRARVSAALAGAIAEVGSAEAVLVVSQNAGAELTDFAVARMINRFGADGALREALAQRDDIGAEMRHALVVATAKALGDFALSCQWMTPQRVERMVGEAGDRAAVTIASAEVSPEIEHHYFAAYLSAGGHMTPALVLRALLSGNLAMVEAVLGELSGRPVKRVGAFLRNPDGLGFAALYKATGLPPELMPVFRAALRVVATGKNGSNTDRPGLDQRLVERVIAICEEQAIENPAKLNALLRRFEAEAARDEARAGLAHLMNGERTLPSFRPWQDLFPPANPVIRVAA